jgi:hypothetical protein
MLVFYYIMHSHGREAMLYHPCPTRQVVVVAAWKTRTRPAASTTRSAKWRKRRSWETAIGTLEGVERCLKMFPPLNVQVIEWLVQQQ